MLELEITRRVFSRHIKKSWRFKAYEVMALRFLIRGKETWRFTSALASFALTTTVHKRTSIFFVFAEFLVQVYKISLLGSFFVEYRIPFALQLPADQSTQKIYRF